MRLQKYLALCGLGSRRKMEEEIAKGAVKVNGAVVTAMGYKVDPEQDQVEYKGRRVRLESEKIYVLLHKPIGTVTTAKDEKNRKTVLDLIDVSQRVYPVGRLDYMTSGLLILTNDGDFTYAMTHPKHEMPKTYHALVKGRVKDFQLEPMRSGMQVNDEKYAPAKAAIKKVEGDYTLLEITISEGRNRQVRKMCEGIGHSVEKLSRVSMGPLTLGNMKPGEWRLLSASEVKTLKELAL